jgi:putative transposase
VLRRLLAITELSVSHSMIEAWWRSLKHHWLFLHALDSVATVRRLVAFHVDEHNRVVPHSAPDARRDVRRDRGHDPGGTRLTPGSARRTRPQANRSVSCKTCPALKATV